MQDRPQQVTAASEGTALQVPPDQPPQETAEQTRDFAVLARLAETWRSEAAGPHHRARIEIGPLLEETGLDAPQLGESLDRLQELWIGAGRGERISLQSRLFVVDRRETDIEVAAGKGFAAAVLLSPGDPAALLRALVSVEDRAETAGDP